MEDNTLQTKIYGCLVGGLIGDAMGEPVEGWDYKKIQQEYGTVNTFAGNGTDDSAVKQIICEALLENDGHITCDEFAESFLRNTKYEHLFYTPVKNMLEKIKYNICLPCDAGMGNMQSSSSAMAISPMGIINACNPRQAAMETYNMAALIHSGATNFCRDAACAMAASVAQAFVPDTTVEAVLEASVGYLHKTSAAVLRNCIGTALDLAMRCGNYEDFRREFHEKHLYTVISDSRETVPAVLAIFYLAGGDPEKSIVYGANFGRDTDTIASMAGALAGAFRGIGAFPGEWVAQIESGGSAQKELAERLTELTLYRAREAAAVSAQLLEVKA